MLLINDAQLKHNKLVNRIPRLSVIHFFIYMYILELLRVLSTKGILKLHHKDCPLQKL